MDFDGRRMHCDATPFIVPEQWAYNLPKPRAEQIDGMDIETLEAVIDVFDLDTDARTLAFDLAKARTHKREQARRAENKAAAKRVAKLLANA